MIYLINFQSLIAELCLSSLLNFTTSLKVLNMKKELNTITTIEQLKGEHDLVLTLCSRIRKGLHHNIKTQRIRNYVEWFRAQYLEPHFELEKKYIFPILGNNVRVKRALAYHRRIIRLLTCSCEDIKVLNLLEEELATLIRFEERTLYHRINQVATPSMLQELQQHFIRIPYNDDNWKDQFWNEES